MDKNRKEKVQDAIKNLRSDDIVKPSLSGYTEAISGDNLSQFKDTIIPSDGESKTVQKSVEKALEGLVDMQGILGAKEEEYISSLMGNTNNSVYMNNVNQSLKLFKRFKQTTDIEANGLKSTILFFTRPELALFDTKNIVDTNDNKFQDAKGLVISSGILDEEMKSILNTGDIEIAKYLDSKAYSPNEKFIPFLTNLFTETSTPESRLGESRSAANVKGTAVKVAAYMSEQSADDKFSVTFHADRFNSVFKFLNLMVKYIRGATSIGSIIPRAETIEQNKLDYTMSIFGFVLGADGETIEHWYQIHGVYPDGDYASAFPGSKEGRRIDQFQVSFVLNTPVDSRKLNTIHHFNHLMGYNESGAKKGWEDYYKNRHIISSEEAAHLDSSYWWTTSYAIIYDEESGAFKLISRSLASEKTFKM